MNKINISKSKLEKAYHLHRTARETAKALGVSHFTVNKLIKEYGIEKTPRSEINHIVSEKCRFNDSKARGKVAKWIKYNPQKVLSRNYKEIAEEIGVSHQAVKQYFYRQRKAIKRFLEEIPDVRNIDIYMRTVKEENIHTSQIKEYWYEVDKFTMEAHMIILTHENDRYKAPIPDIRDFLTTVRMLKSSA